MSEIVVTLEHEGNQYVLRQDWPLYDGDTVDDQRSHAYYMWVDGNYGCDCNRKLFIEHEYKEDSPFDPDEDGHYPCGETIKLVSLVLDGHDLLAPTLNERMAAIGLVPSFTLLGDLSPGTVVDDEPTPAPSLPAPDDSSR